jgi:hypothetical protein
MLKMEKKKTIYFMGTVKECMVVSDSEKLPKNSRYVCDSEGYSIYDSQEFEEKYYAVK